MKLLAVLSPNKRQCVCEREVTALCCNLVRRYKETARLFLEKHSGKTRGYRHKLQLGKIQLVIRKVFSL